MRLPRWMVLTVVCLLCMSTLACGSEVRKGTMEDMEWTVAPTYGTTTVTSAGGHVGHPFPTPAYVDVRSYGAVGNGTTDDTAAIQAAINASGYVLFPPGIYAISSTLNLRTASEYRGPRGGTVFQGSTGPSAGYGAAIKWIGADSSVIVNMEGTYSTVWDGIDIFGDTSDVTSAALASGGLTGIRIHSDNDPSSQRNRISNTRIWNCNYGIIVGGLPDASYTYQTDGWVIENFWIYLVNTGIYLNGGNATQYSEIRNGMIGQFSAGINIYEGSYQGIKSVAFNSLESPTAGEANIILRLPRVTTIELTQGEPQTGTLWPHIRFTYGATLLPVRLIGNHVDGEIQIANSNSSQNIISIGNNYDNVVISGNDVVFTSMNDYFTTSSSIQDGGTSNHIKEIDAYYEGSSTPYISYRTKFNNIVKEQRLYNTVDLRSNGLTTFSANDATPSVLNGDFFQTANSAPTTITNFDDGIEGQRIFVMANDANTTIDFTGSNIRGNSGVDKVMSQGDWIEGRMINGYWYVLVGDWS